MQKHIYKVWFCVQPNMHRSALVIAASVSEALDLMAKSNPNAFQLSAEAVREVNSITSGIVYTSTESFDSREEL